MTVDLTRATSLSTVAGYGLALSRGILNRTTGGHGSEHCVEVQCTADEAVETVASPLGETQSGERPHPRPRLLPPPGRDLRLLCGHAPG